MASQSFIHTPFKRTNYKSQTKTSLNALSLESLAAYCQHGRSRHIKDFGLIRALSLSWMTLNASF